MPIESNSAAKSNAFPDAYKGKNLSQTALYNLPKPKPTN
jgi:hypothetical protein